MKRLLFTMVAVALMGVASAKVVKGSIKVNGYQSKDKIEKAAKNVQGVKKASYSEKTKKIDIQYNDEQTSPEKIRTAVLKVDKKAAQAKNTQKAAPCKKVSSSTKKIAPKRK